MDADGGNSKRTKREERKNILICLEARLWAAGKQILKSIVMRNKMYNSEPDIRGCRMIQKMKRLK